jgi:hypothetical protein
MVEQKPAELNQFITRVQKATSAKQVLSIMDEFRKVDWTDDDRARMAKAYVRVLDRVGAPPPDENAVVEEDKNDGPVWYEKM